MPDGESTQQSQGQEPANTPAAGEGGSSSGRSIDSFPAEAQDYIRRLREENASHRTKVKEMSGKLQQFEDQNKSEAQKTAERLEAAERRAAESDAKILRYTVAADKGLPLKYADRLRGSTQEELAADADQLMKDFGLTEEEGPAGRPGFDGGVRRPVRKAKTMNGFIRAASGR